MKIVIEHRGLKREISGTGFNLCGSPEEMLHIASEIQREAADMTGYGWIKIRDAQADEHAAAPNSRPFPWM